MRLTETSRVVKSTVLAAGLGTMLDYYDFLLAANAAGTVWLSQYFEPAFKIPGIALSLAMVTYAVAYVTRPLGAFIFGHIGDRVGRRYTLVLTLLLAFASMVIMGLTPTYSQIGIYSIMLLLISRLILGIGFGGEWGGGATWISEVMMANGCSNLGFWGGVFQAFATVGIALASLAFSFSSLLMPHQFFYSWGWRILFLVGAAVIVIAAIIRHRLIESPLFMELAKRGEVLRYPAIEVFKREWLKVMLLALAWFYITAVTTVAVLPYSVTYVSKALGIGTLMGMPASSFILLAYAISLLTGGVASTLISGSLSDKYNPLLILVIGSVATGIMSVLFYPLLATGNPAVILITFEAYMASEYMGFGSLPKLFTLLFPTVYRYSGSGLAYQLGGLLTGLASGLILPVIISTLGYSAWYAVSALMASISLASLASSLALLKVTPK
ncbi:MFS transporter [Caldivirga sp. UBA161]|uniref:MFS transporter n=1 Tax=Caldivirga sp. UBA161 TaxID=1915569 RepID=UPI0025C506FC|nr:MFS transporter [Caldivirga sp. UBA161]